jgi:hypothetical protein
LPRRQGAPPPACPKCQRNSLVSGAKRRAVRLPPAHRSFAVVPPGGRDHPDTRGTASPSAFPSMARCWTNCRLGASRPGAVPGGANFGRLNLLGWWLCTPGVLICWHRAQAACSARACRCPWNVWAFRLSRASWKTACCYSCARGPLLKGRAPGQSCVRRTENVGGVSTSAHSKSGAATVTPVGRFGECAS